MNVFAVTTMRGPAWDDEQGIQEQIDWHDHAEVMDNLVAQGAILLGGPVEDPDSSVVALLAVVAPDTAAVHELFADDPWIRSGILRLKTVHAWTIWLDRGPR